MTKTFTVLALLGLAGVAGAAFFGVPGPSVLQEAPGVRRLALDDRLGR